MQHFSYGKNWFARPNTFESILLVNQTHFWFCCCRIYIILLVNSNTYRFGFILLLILRHLAALALLPVSSSSIVTRDWLVFYGALNFENFSTMASCPVINLHKYELIGCTKSNQIWHWIELNRIVFSERDLMFMFAICRRASVCRLSSVCNVRAPYSDDWNFPQCFCAI